MIPEPFRLLVADPPWKFGDKLPGPSRGAAKNYACLTVEQIETFPLPPMADDSILLLWRVASMQEEALRVVRAWDFTVKSEIVWQKSTRLGKPWFGMGRYVRASHEVCLIATRGHATELVLDHSIRSVFEALEVLPEGWLEAPAGAHSEKPSEFYALAEDLFSGPRAELFARKRRAGWTQSGFELETATQ